MTVQFEVWQLLSLAITLIGAFGAVFKLLLVQHQRHQDRRFDSIEASAEKEAGQWQAVERELLLLKAELPLNYVRREDYIRGQSVIEAKLDGLATKIENAQLRGVLSGGGRNHAD
ncbi:hypothetical protein G8A07_15730 [Roseateles sp. DAIF2]|uniref:hypothetical protein n=1 Tax=Roseateles sp. DAIF2 TaxID=2714952 RepID=UPI0018A26D54|nr:hypothetical protein [Roseateles sp. DAIF2]QPF74225.1 hypothetical protein G8A07_15730 [Roseateles sp. DAIF2]